MKTWQIILILLAIACVLLGMFYIGYYAEHPTPKQPNYYSISAIVVSVDYTLDRVTAKDCNGSLWQFTGAEDWMIGDICACTMDDNKTEKISDDKIVNVKYCGTLEMLGN